MKSSDHINTNFTHCHTWVIIFKSLDLRPKSVCSVRMYVHWTCINICTQLYTSFTVGCNIVQWITSTLQIMRLRQCFGDLEIILKMTIEKLIPMRPQNHWVPKLACRSHGITYATALCSYTSSVSSFKNYKWAKWQGLEKFKNVNRRVLKSFQILNECKAKSFNGKIHYFCK